MRITSMNRVDIRRFEFDFDTTWAGFFTDSELHIYSRYGGRDEHEPEARLSKPSLLHTMREVLSSHRQAELARKANLSSTSNVDALKLWHPEPATSATPLDMPLLRKNHSGCVHCHQVREYSLLQAFHDGQFRRDLLFPFPLPETLGLEIDRSHGHRLAKVTDDSAASRAGLVAGDWIVRCDDVPIRSEQDLRWALHRLSSERRTVSITIARPRSSTSNSLSDSRETRTVEFKLPDRWRQSPLHWRKSSRSLPVDWGFRAAAMSKSERREAKLPDDGMAILVLSVKPQGFAAALQLNKSDIILSANGESRHRSLDQLRSDWLRQFQPGDEVVLIVRRGEETLTLKGAFPNWHTNETTVP